jgi:nucleoside-diphosphate-sugar epimerase
MIDSRKHDAMTDRGFPKVVIVGATGFVGGRLTREMRKRSFDVVALARAGRQSPPDATELVIVDFNDAHAVAASLKGAETILHVAGLAHATIRDEARARAMYQQANVALVKSVAEAAVSESVRRFVLLSSAGVLGRESPEGGFAEDAQPAPYDHYTQSKFDGELALTQTAASSAMQAVIVRTPMIYGPRAPGTFSRLVQWLDSGRPLPLGSVATVRSTIGIRNLADALCAIAAHRDPLQGPMLLCDAECVAVSEFCHMIAQRRPRARVVRFPPALIRLALSVLWRGDDARRLFGAFELRATSARNRLNWRPPYSVREEIAHALEAYG